ncbi:restriction endonuclease subunit S [Helicobacter bilis]|uniref:restriction endonuclease subunit S n=1 Tax=Helicobacter bilis TaxID=37372 RepID=UPI0026F2BB4A|nr:restriction endonuclease subunit S [Helicobacter bilis]
MEGNALSPRLVKLEKEFKQNGGEWRDIEIHKLFTPQNGDFDIQKIHLNDKGHQVVSAGLENNGVIGKTDIKARIFPKNTLTCDMFGNVFYRDFEYKMVTHARVMCLHPLFELNKKTGLYIASVMNYFKLLFCFADMATWSKISNLKLSLPVLPTACHTDLERSEREVSQNIESKKDFSPTAQNDKNTKSNAEAVEMRKQGKAEVSLVNCGFQGGGEGSYLKGNDRADNADAVAKQQIHTCKSAIYRSNATQGYKIAFNYMESYIKALEAERLQELEAERLQELEAYLKVTGLNDYTLSQKEKDALKAFENLSTPNERERE